VSQAAQAVVLGILISTLLLLSVRKFIRCEDRRVSCKVT
jgi:hypothetical protein